MKCEAAEEEARRLRVALHRAEARAHELEADVLERRRGAFEDASDRDESGFGDDADAARRKAAQFALGADPGAPDRPAILKIAAELRAATRAANDPAAAEADRLFAALTDAGARSAEGGRRSAEGGRRSDEGGRRSAEEVRRTAGAGSDESDAGDDSDAGDAGGGIGSQTGAGGPNPNPRGALKGGTLEVGARSGEVPGGSVPASVVPSGGSGVSALDDGYAGAKTREASARRRGGYAADPGVDDAGHRRFADERRKGTAATANDARRPSREPSASGVRPRAENATNAREPNAREPPRAVSRRLSLAPPPTDAAGRGAGARARADGSSSSGGAFGGGAGAGRGRSSTRRVGINAAVRDDEASNDPLRRRDSPPRPNPRSPRASPTRFEPNRTRANRSGGIAAGALDPAPFASPPRERPSASHLPPPREESLPEATLRGGRPPWDTSPTRSPPKHVPMTAHVPDRYSPFGFGRTPRSRSRTPSRSPSRSPPRATVGAAPSSLARSPPGSPPKFYPAGVGGSRYAHPGERARGGCDDDDDESKWLRENGGDGKTLIVGVPFRPLESCAE